MLSIQTNISSLGVLRQSDSINRSVSSCYERLSSGQRINRASDDAAGLAIAESLKTDVRLYSTSVRNINDAISALSIITSGLAAQKGILIRLSELAEQSANGVYAPEQREALNGEYYELLKEFDRIADTTSFNSIQFLAGDGGDAPESLSLQVGIDGSSDSSLTLETSDTGQFSGTMGAKGDYDEDGDVDLNDFFIFQSSYGHDLTYAEAEYLGGGTELYQKVIDASGQRHDLVFIPHLYNFTGPNRTPETDGNRKFYLVAYEDDGCGTLDFLGLCKSENELNEDYANSVWHRDYTAPDGSSTRITLDLRSTQWEDILSGSEISETSVGFTDIRTQDRALEALTTVKARLSELSQTEGAYGALQSRLETAASVSVSLRENSLQAESRIRDADIASESADLVRGSILQQVSSAVLGQANQQPRLALELLSRV